MAAIYLSACAALDRAAMALCGFLVLLLAAMVLSIVIMRYGFGTGFIELQDAANYTFAILAIFCIPVCLARGGHVRVEVISERLSPTYRRTADALALIFFLIPVFGLMIWFYLPELEYSWSIREASLETGGLNGLYLVKTALPVAAALTILQGIAATLRGDAAA